MRDQDIRKALDKYASRKAHRRDLWPAVRQQVTPTRDGVHVMAVGGRAGVLLPGAVLALVVIAALFIVPILQGAASPQSAGLAAQATATPAPQKAAANGTDYGALLTQSFAAQLGVSSDKINSAFAAAVKATVDQAVKDGAMDSATGQRLTAGPGANFGSVALGALKMDAAASGVEGSKEKGVGVDADAVLTGVAALFGMNLGEFNTALKNGETLTSMEQKHNVSHEQVRQAGQAAMRDALAQGVQGGKWTQADADALSPDIAQIVDNILAKLTSSEQEDPLTATIMKSVEDGAAQALGMSHNDLMQAVDGGQSLTSLEQAHNVSHDQVRAKAIEVATAALSAGVSSGDWTQAEADAAAKTVPDYADKVLGKLSLADKPKTETK